MTAMIGSADCPPARLAATRDGLHRVAEHLLAAARYAASGEIGLIPAPGGFRTPPFGPDGRFLAVDGTELVVGDATVKTHVARIFSKLNLHDRAQAVVLAYESGLVQPGETPTQT